MRYKGYILPYNPSYFSVKRSRNLLTYKLHKRVAYVQQSGMNPTVVSGRGVFFGKKAFAEFEKLKAVFNEESSGSLVLPNGERINAIFASLGLIGEAGKEPIEYSFEFVEEVRPNSGLTLKYLCKNLKSRNPLSVEIATLLLKKEKQKTDVACKYLGFYCPDEFVVGYGLDYSERYRNLSYIGVLDPKVYS